MARQKNDGRGRLGGRQKGTPNKSTSSLREIISEHWQHYQDSGQFKKDLDALDPQTRAVVMERYAQYIAPKMKSVDMERYAQYIAPKMKSVDMEVTAKVTHTIEDKLLELSEEPDEDD